MMFEPHKLSSALTGASAMYGERLRIDQIAFYAPDERYEKQIKRMLRLSEANWTEDIVKARGYVSGSGVDLLSNRAKLLFNYDYGIELEILRYLEGENYVKLLGRDHEPHMCHIGMHLAEGHRKEDFNFPVTTIQEVLTYEHSNPGVGDRRYRYTILNFTPLFGTCLKLIERINPAEKSNA